MGTRGLWGFRKDNQDKLTYNHFDSYPSALGKTIQDFILKHPIIDLKAIADRIIMVSEDKKPTNEQIKQCQKFADLSVSNKDIHEWYCLLRNSQGDPKVYANGLRFMIDSHDFIKDSLFCEWAYIINLDTQMLEIYEGFKKTPQNNRYKSEVKDGYANCKLLKEIPFDKLKDLQMDKIEK